MGKAIGLFYGPLGIKESNEAEIEVIRHALRLFCENQLDRVKEVIIESDSTAAVAWVNKCSD